MIVHAVRQVVRRAARAAAVAAGVALLWAGSAQAAGEVNVYSYRQPFLIKPLFDAFTRESGIKVNVVYAPKGMVERIKQEGRNSPADMIFTVDIGRLHDAVEADVLQAVRTPTLERSVPEAYRHPGGLWYGLTLRSRLVYASKERVPQGKISSYEQLAAPEWKGRICMRSSQHEYNVGLLASLIAHNGVPAAERWAQGLKDNLAQKPQGNDRAQVRAIKEGVCDLAIVNHYYMAAMLADKEQSAWADAVYLVFPNQDGRGTHVNISGAGVTKYAPNRDNAVKLLEFLSSEFGQRLYAEQNNEYPVRAGAPWSALLESWGRFKTDSLSLTKIAENRAEAIKVFDRVGIP